MMVLSECWLSRPHLCTRQLLKQFLKERWVTVVQLLAGLTDRPYDIQSPQAHADSSH